MKRFNKTAIAVALSGAMTLGVAPAALADPTKLPEAIECGGTTWYLSKKNGNHYVAEPDLVNQPLGRIEDQKKIQKNDLKDRCGIAENPDASTGASAGETEVEQPDASGSTDGQDESREYGTGIPVTLKKGDTIRNSKGEDVLTAEYDGVVAVAQPGDHIYDANNVDVSTFRGLKVDPDDGLNAPEKEVEDDTAAAIAAAVGITALPLALIIGGVKYIWDQNNKVYVPEEKAGQEPTAEDKAASDKLISENAEEIKRQAASAEKNGEGVEQVDGSGSAGVVNDEASRGVNAETGNNAIAKGLVGLLIASIMGAAIFAYGRRRLV